MRCWISRKRRVRGSLAQSQSHDKSLQEAPAWGAVTSGHFARKRVLLCLHRLFRLSLREPTAPVKRIAQVGCSVNYVSASFAVVAKARRHRSVALRRSQVCLKSAVGPLHCKSLMELNTTRKLNRLFERFDPWPSPRSEAREASDAGFGTGSVVVSRQEVLRRKTTLRSDRCFTGPSERASSPAELGKVQFR